MWPASSPPEDQIPGAAHAHLRCARRERGVILHVVGPGHGNHITATKARTGLFVALGAAALAGISWLNWLIVHGDQI